MRKKFLLKKTIRSGRKKKEFISRDPEKYLNYIKSNEMRKYKDQITAENGDLKYWNCREIGVEMEGNEEEMKQCLLIFAQILFPQCTDCLQFCFQGNTGDANLNDTRNEANRNGCESGKEISEPAIIPIGFMDDIDDDCGNEKDMKESLFLFAQILFPQFQHCLQKCLIEEDSFTKQTNRGEDDKDKNGDFFGSEEDMKQCLLLLAQILYPQFAQYLQECCGSETGKYIDSQGSVNIGEQSARNITNTESYGNEEDMKECLLLLAQVLYPQFASYFQEYLENENIIYSEEHLSPCNYNKECEEDSIGGVCLAVA